MTKPTPATMFRLLQFFRPYKHKLFLALFFMIVSISMQLPLPFLTRYVVDKVIAQKSIRMLNIVGVALIGTLLLQIGSIYFQRLLLSVFKNRVLFDIRVKLFEHIQKLPFSFYQDKQTGYLMSRLSDDVRAIQGLWADTFISASQNIIYFIVGVMCLLYIHTKLALICFSILPLYLISFTLFNKKVRHLSRLSKEKYALTQKDLQETLSGIYIIRAFTAEIQATLKLISNLKEVVKAEIKLDITSTIAAITSVLISSMGPLVLVWYGCREIMYDRLTIGGLIAFNSFMGYLFSPIRVIVDINMATQRSLPAVERIFEVFDEKLEEDRGIHAVIKLGEIKFNNVKFAYDGKKNILDGVSFKIEPNSTVAIVGGSGSGKTTIISLLLKYYCCTHGEITIDGINILNINNKSLRMQLGLVTQDTFLFSDTISENIRIGRPGANKEEIEKAAIIANAHDFIMEMPEGYKTKIGERGCTLSGGQRQRISIARAVLKDPKILILDEATSQVDNELEYHIKESLNALFKNRTILVVAHRLSTIQKANKILVVDGGQVVEEGTHEQLYCREGRYNKLYQTEFKRS